MFHVYCHRVLYSQTVRGMVKQACKHLIRVKMNVDGVYPIGYYRRLTNDIVRCVSPAILSQ